jgi:hypothetical protein
MKKVIILFLAFAAIYSCTEVPRHNTLTRKEVKDGWILLFDGETSNGWTSSRNDRDFPDAGWVIEDGMITLDNTIRPRPGDIITEESFQNFELSLDFRIAEAGNSGIKYYILPGTTLGLEFQILDDDKHPDATQGRNGNRLQGGLYDMIHPSNQVSNPPGEWNHARIVAKDNKIQHWLNGVKVVEFERFTQEWDELKELSKFRTDANWGTPTQSPILLQDHADVVSFKNIKIRRL